MKNEKFDPQEIIDRIGSGEPRNPLAHINEYNDQMSISQVVRFFEKQGIILTKTMIQNYVRLEILPPPVDKRYYTREHFMILSMLMALKDLFPLEVFRDVFSVFRELEREDIMIACYNSFFEMQRETAQNLRHSLPNHLEAVRTATEQLNSNELKNDRLAISLTFLSLMVQCAAAKQIADAFAEKYI